MEGRQRQAGHEQRGAASEHGVASEPSGTEGGARKEDGGWLVRQGEVEENAERHAERREEIKTAAVPQPIQFRSPAAATTFRPGDLRSSGYTPPAAAC